MIAAIGLAASSSAHAPPLSDPRLAGVLAATLGALLLADGLWVTSLGGGWRVVAVSTAALGAVAVLTGAAGFMLNRGTAASAVATAWVVIGMFAVTPLVTPGLRAQPMARVFWFAGGALIAPWAVGAIAWALAPASSASGGIAELGAAIGVYVFAWTIVKGLMKISSDIWDSPPSAAGVVAAMKASLGGSAFIAALVAVGLGLGDLLIGGSGLAPGTQRFAGFLLAFGALVVACLFFLACAAIPRLGRAVSLGATVGVFLVAKAAVLLLFAAYLAPSAVLAAGAVGVAVCLVAQAIPASLTREAGPAQDQSPAPAE